MPSLANHYPNFGDSGVATPRRDSQHIYLGWSGHAVVELHTFAQALDVRAAWVARDERDVFLGHLVARMGEAKSEITIVGEQQQSCGVGVEAAHREQAVARLSL